jgi:hypothetical protein
MDTFTSPLFRKCMSRIKNKAALFTTVIKAKTLEHNINFDIKKTGR